MPILGIIVPKMGSSITGAARIQDALFSGVQQRLLGIIFGQPDRRFPGAELIRMINSGTGAVHRQLTSLAASGLVNVTRTGNQKHYQANSDSPVFEELRGLIRKTVGLREPLQRSLEPLNDQVNVAEYKGHLEVDEQLVSDLVSCAKSVYDSVSELRSVT